MCACVYMCVYIYTYIYIYIIFKISPIFTNRGNFTAAHLILELKCFMLLFFFSS